MTDNAWAYRKSLAWKAVLADLGATGKLTRAYRPQTNGKVERFNRPLLDERAYLRPCTSNSERTAALADFLHTYNHHRCHTALGGQPPITRVNNPAGQYTWSLSLWSRSSTSQDPPDHWQDGRSGGVSRHSMAISSALWSFALVVGLLTLTPGLDTALILRTSALGRRRRTWGVVLGIQTGTTTPCPLPWLLGDMDAGEQLIHRSVLLLDLGVHRNSRRIVLVASWYLGVGPAHWTSSMWGWSGDFGHTWSWRS